MSEERSEQEYNREVLGDTYDDVVAELAKGEEKITLVPAQSFYNTFRGYVQNKQPGSACNELETNLERVAVYFEPLFRDELGEVGEKGRKLVRDGLVEARRWLEEPSTLATFVDDKAPQDMRFGIERLAEGLVRASPRFNLACGRVKSTYGVN